MTAENYNLAVALAGILGILWVIYITQTPNLAKYCTHLTCNEKLTWDIKNGRRTFFGFCPSHGHVCGTLGDRPLTGFWKKLMILRGHKFRRNLE